MDRLANPTKGTSHMGNTSRSHLLENPCVVVEPLLGIHSTVTLLCWKEAITASMDEEMHLLCFVLVVNPSMEHLLYLVLAVGPPHLLCILVELLLGKHPTPMFRKEVRIVSMEKKEHSWANCGEQSNIRSI